MLRGCGSTRTRTCTCIVPVAPCVARYQPAPAAAGLLFSPPKGEPQLIHLTFACMQHALPFPSTKSQKKQPPPCSSYFFLLFYCPPLSSSLRKTMKKNNPRPSYNCIYRAAELLIAGGLVAFGEDAGFAVSWIFAHHQGRLLMRRARDFDMVIAF